MGMVCVINVMRLSIAILSQGTPCKQTRPPLPRAAEQAAGWTGLGGVALLAWGLFIVFVGIYLGSAIHWVYVLIVSSSPGAPRGLATRVIPL